MRKGKSPGGMDKDAARGVRPRSGPSTGSRRPGAQNFYWNGADAALCCMVLESSNSHRSYEKRTPEGDAEGTFLRPDQPARPTALRGALPCKREDVGISGFRRLQRQAAPVAQRRRCLREAWREIPLIGGVGLGWKPSMITQEFRSGPPWHGTGFRLPP